MNTSKIKIIVASLAALLVFTAGAFAGGIKEIGSVGELDGLISSGKPVVADFYASWCGPCKMLSPILEDLASEFSGKATFVKINVDSQGALSQKYGISAIPDVRIFNEGKQYKKMLGLRDKKEYARVLKEIT
jgi:thioredoxin 1